MATLLENTAVALVFTGSSVTPKLVILTIKFVENQNL